MAHTESLPDAVLDHVARQLAGRLGTLDPSLAEVSVGLAESFPVWLLEQPHGGETLDELATRTNQWHHQIRTGDGRAVAFARSTYPSGSGDEDDEPGLAMSDIAARLDDTIVWIDRNVPGDPLVRLLVAPAYHLHAFWLTEPVRSSVVVSDFPADIGEIVGGYLYSDRDFLAALRSAAPITGVRGPFEPVSG